MILLYTIISFIIILFINFTYYKTLKQEKFKFIISLHPTIFIFIILIKISKCYYKNIKNTSALKTELPKLIYYLNCYLVSGMELSQSLNKLASNHKWNRSLLKHIKLINFYYAKGNSLEIAIEKVIKDIDHNKNYYLYFFLNTLKICSLNKGNITLILDNLRNRLIEKNTAEKKIHTFTSQIRFQALIISLAPFVLAFIIFFLSPHYIFFFFNNKYGIMLLIFISILYILGISIIYKITRIIK